MLLNCCSLYRSNRTQLPNAQPALLEAELRSYVETISAEIGERNCFHPEGLDRAATWIETELKSSGYIVERQNFEIHQSQFGCKTSIVSNLVAELPGTTRPDEILIVGAHYDSKVATPGWHDHGPALPNDRGTPGANDNGSGVAALLAIAKQMAGHPGTKTLRFVFFVNEEPPFFKDRAAMGSWVYAQQCKRRKESIIGAIVLDALGTYSSQPNRKRKSFGFLPTLIGLPDRTDYVAFMSNYRSRKFMLQCARLFQNQAAIDLRAVSIPAFSSIVAWSDDWSFWQEGYPAFTITDTAYLRAEQYHELSDTAEKIDYPTFAAVVGSLQVLAGVLIQ